MHIMEKTTYAFRTPTLAYESRKPFLIISEEGDTILHQLIPAILESYGYPSVCAGSDQELRYALSTGQKFLGLVADARVYNRRGSEWVRRIRERIPGLPALLIGGHGDKDSFDKELEAGGRADLLCIPFSPAQVLERIEALIAHPAH